MPIIDAVRKAQTTLGDPNMMQVNPPDTFAHPPADEGPSYSPMTRCPLPFINSSSDNLRTFYRDSIPCYRIIPRPQ